MARWVDKTIDQVLTMKNIMLKFKITRIQPLNPKAMEDKTSLDNLYTLVNVNKEEEDDTTSNEEDETMLCE